MTSGFYLQVLFDCAWKASIIPMGNDAAFFAMKDFGGFNMHLALALAILGATLGQIFNWYIGRMLYTGAIRSTPRNRLGMTLFFAVISVLAVICLIDYAALLLVPGGEAVVLVSVGIIIWLAMRLVKHYRANPGFIQPDVIAPLFRRYGVFLLLFSPVPLFNIVTVAAGFFDVKPQHAWLLLLISAAAYYGHYFF